MGVGQRWPQAAGTADRNGGIRTMRIGVGGGETLGWPFSEWVDFSIFAL